MAGRRQHTVRESFEDLRAILVEYKGKPQEQRIRMLIMIKQTPLQSLKEVADGLGVGENRIRRWWHVYQSEGFEKLMHVRPWRHQKDVKPEVQSQTTPLTTYSHLLSLVQSVARLAKVPDRRTWLTSLKHLIISTLPEVDYAIVHQKFRPDAANPQCHDEMWSTRDHYFDDAAKDQFAVRYRPTPGGDEALSPSQRLIKEGMQMGFRFEDYHEPAAFEIYYGNDQYNPCVGVILLLREKQSPHFSCEFLEIFRGLHDYWGYVFTDFSLRYFSVNETRASTRESWRVLVSNRELTQREKEILTYLLSGDSYEIISKTLSISKSTVKKHVQEIFRKLGVRRLNELIGIYLGLRES